MKAYNLMTEVSQILSSSQVSKCLLGVLMCVFLYNSLLFIFFTGILFRILTFSPLFPIFIIPNLFV